MILRNKIGQIYYLYLSDEEIGAQKGPWIV